MEARMLKNKVTGVVFTWTPELAKLADLEPYVAPEEAAEVEAIPEPVVVAPAPTTKTSKKKG
jgi:hypothetical protein